LPCNIKDFVKSLAYFEAKAMAIAQNGVVEEMNSLKAVSTAN
jgi:hypothetical protein